MGLIIGLDFGTTYSMLSKKEDSTGIIVPCKNNNEELVEDSLVFISEAGKVHCGKGARSKVGAKGTLFSGFKMLLNEDNPDELESQHYTEKITPSYITKRYLDELLKKCMTAYSVNKIERLVIGVPDVWDKQAKKNEKSSPLYKNRNTLLKIVNSLGYVDDVELYSEPELASAYYLDNYRRTINPSGYTGHLLLIDYGGGTLDVAICKFDSGSKGKARVLKTFGEGWNEKGKKGDAGLAFMKRVVELAVKDAGLEPDERKMRKSLYCLEAALINMSDEQIRTMHSIFDNGLIKDVANSRRYQRVDFDDSLEYGDENLTVTYKHLAMAYVQIIEPVLAGDEKRAGVLIQAREWMNSNGIDWREKANNQNFKIQLVGGFSNFYLVQKTVEEVLHRDEHDIRFLGGFQDMNARNYAVSFGAALVANRDITITRTAHYSLGICGFLQKLVNNRHVVETIPYFATHIKDEIVPGKIFLASLPNGEPKIFNGNKIEFFAYCDDPSESPDNIQQLKAKEDYEERLQLEDTNSPYIFGISFNKSLIITVYKWKVLDGGKRILSEYKAFSRIKEHSQTFGDAISQDPAAYSLAFESSDSLDEIYTLTGVSLT